MDTSPQPQYIAAPVLDGGALADIRITVAGKVWHMWGKNGADRERSLAEAVPEGTLPLLLGAGLGHCLRELASRGPVAVVDREPFLRELAGIDAIPANVTLISTPDTQIALKEVRAWRAANGNLPLHLVRIPLYQRLSPDHYGLTAKTLESENRSDFWARANYPKFRQTKPRILFLRADYFLSNEIETALGKLEIPFQALPVGTGGAAGNDYVESLLESILQFKPDFALTVNHFGLDREGKITGLLERMGLPLASWFVDNPHLILYRYQGLDAANVALFSFDAFKLDILRDRGFRHVHYLPLATDPDRFRPGMPGKPEWRAEVSFVGNSMTTAVNETLKAARPSPLLRDQYTSIASDYGASAETSVTRFIQANHPELAEEIAAATSIERQLALESLITWESTRQYRLKCVRQTLGHTPLIAGDNAWKRLLPGDGSWRYHPTLNYYGELPAFYPSSTISFNCTSLQMKGAVNQRVFDVPACGGFLLTDHREQMESLFSPGSEIAIYNDTDEIPHQLERYLQDRDKRRAMVERARKRILARHTYQHRIQELCRIMRETFS
ncbi:CgeB family protein [Salidesulfovibrio onnuriiensis]|uniref:CgeB family protein n=1 Tax=Salidesulfovibrio onnuriiensis TaxID=2583823 RepID=UPI0011C78092|nr:glycosyltransferase [Salidesulfovibrio onnuriiensis]